MMLWAPETAATLSTWYISLAYSSIQFDCHEELTVDGYGICAGSVPPLNAVIAVLAGPSSAPAGGPLLMYRMKFAAQALVAGLTYVVCAALVADVSSTCVPPLV